jgi:uncharacterized protein (TIGR02246 family)
MKRAYYSWKIRAIYLTILLGLSIGGCGQSTGLLSRDKEAIWGVRKHTEDAINNGDAKNLKSLFAEDPVFVVCNGPILQGLEAIEKMHVEFFRENPGFKTEFKRQHISFPTKDIAIETVSYVDRFPGQPPRYGGDTTFYLKKNGKWMINFIRMHPSELNAEEQSSHSIASPHQLELIATENPMKISEGVYQVGWIRTSLPSDESHVQMIPVQMYEPDVNWTQWGLNKQDVNFDGYLDIAVCQHGGAKWGRFYWFLYDPENMEFYTNTLTKELSELTCAGLKADPKTKRIKRTQFIGAEITEYTYEIVDGHLNSCVNEIVTAGFGY